LVGLSPESKKFNSAPSTGTEVTAGTADIIIDMAGAAMAAGGALVSPLG
jgi:hypothetical protein